MRPLMGCCLVAVAVGAAQPAWAQAPGEDPVVLNRKVIIGTLPLGAPATSTAPSLADGMPAWQRARIARFEAKSFAADKGGILTDRDVINTVHTDGVKTACVQSVGSAPIPKAGARLQSNEQVVVVRGDLVNICN